ALRQRGHRLRQRVDEVLPLAFLAALLYRARAVGVVDGENLRLGHGAGGSAAGRVVRIALQLGGPALVALGQDTLGEAAVGDGGGVEERLAWGDLLGRPH